MTPRTIAPVWLEEEEADSYTDGEGDELTVEDGKLVV